MNIDFFKIFGKEIAYETSFTTGLKFNDLLNIVKIQTLHQ